MMFRPASRLVRERPLTALGVALLLVSLIFIAAPGLDLWASSLFHDPRSGFPLSSDPWLRGLREASERATVAAISLAALGVAVPLLLRRRFGLAPSDALYVLAVHLVGPGLIVNAFLKETFGRARPRAVAEFGGESLFTPPWFFSDACASNCSFAGGEAASAIALMTLAIVAPPGYRWPIGWAILFVAGAISLNRVAFGGHFLSDILIAWLLVAIVIAALRPFFTGAAGTAIERALLLTIPQTAAAQLWRPLVERLRLRPPL